MTSQNTFVGNEVFESPKFTNRVKSMLKLDFYRLFQTPVFYIMLVIAAIIPAMVLSLSGADMSPPRTQGRAVSEANDQPNQSAQTENIPQMTMPMFENAWQMVETTKNPTHTVNSDDNPIDMGQFMSINMLFIFAGLLMSIFVAHDYSSGYVKNIFTVHSQKIDYVISKSAIGIFSGAGMIITYVIGTVVAGFLTGKAFDVEVSGLILCLLSKALLMGVFCSLFLGIAVFFRNRLWLTIVFTFLLGMMLYPAGSIATLDSTLMTLLISLLASVGGTGLIGVVSNLILKKRDLA